MFCVGSWQFPEPLAFLALSLHLSGQTADPVGFKVGYCLSSPGIVLLEVCVQCEIPCVERLIAEQKEVSTAKYLAWPLSSK